MERGGGVSEPEGLLKDMYLGYVRCDSKEGGRERETLSRKRDFFFFFSNQRKWETKWKESSGRQLVYLFEEFFISSSISVFFFSFLLLRKY